MTTDRRGERDPRTAATDHYTVTDQTASHNDGFSQYLHDLGRLFCQAADGQVWRAEAWTPARPDRNVDQHDRIQVTIDNRMVVQVVRTVPAFRLTEQWTITVDDVPVPHRPLPGEHPRVAAALARSLWRHLIEFYVQPCLCGQPATVASWGCQSTCPDHIH